MPKRILYVQFIDPAAYPPLEHSSHILADRGWDVLMLGTDAFSVKSLEFSSNPRINIKNLSLRKTGGRLSVHYIIFFFWCLYWAVVWRPRWIYASDPLVAPVAYMIRKLTGVRVLYHEHDAPVEGTHSSAFMRAALVCRKKLGREAELCVFPQQDRLNEFLILSGRKAPTICVWNCPRLSEIPSEGEYRALQAERSDEKLIVYYHGSINSERLPRTLVQAAARFNGAVRLRIAGYEAPGCEGYLDLIELASTLGQREMVEFLGGVPRRELLRTAAAADVGLSLMPQSASDPNLRQMLGASNKAFDYMAARLALLVSDLPDWNSAFVQPGYARACIPTDPGSIASQFEWFLKEKNARLEMGRRNGEKIAREWNYDTMFATAVERLEKD